MKVVPLVKIYLVLVVLLLGSALAMAQYGGGQYEILSARKGTAKSQCRCDATPEGNRKPGKQLSDGQLHLRG